MGTLGKTLPKRTLMANQKYVGRRFGSRIVLAIAGVTTGYQMWRVRCDCGLISEVSGLHLTKGRSLRCVDCQRRDQTAHRAHTWRGGAHIPMTMFNRRRRSAERRDLEWAMTIPYLDRQIVRQKFCCVLTGRKLIFNFGYNGDKNGNASLDRIDCGRGYLPGNVRFVLKDINFARQQLPDDVFIALCLEVVEHSERTRR